MAAKPTTTDEQLTEAAQRALTGDNLVAEAVQIETTPEFAAFKALLRQVVKPVPKHVTEAASDDKA